MVWGPVNTSQLFSMRRLCSPYSTLLLVLFFASSVMAAIPWPKDYVVAEDSKSGNGRYGVLIPARDSSSADLDQPANYFANLEKHKILGQIRNSFYSEGRNHQALGVYWAPDFSWVVVEYDGRFGFDSLTIAEVGDDAINQTDVGREIQQSINAVIAKAEHTSKEIADVSVYCRPTSERRLKVRALATTDPKQLDPAHGFYALFQGTYDLASKKWKVTDTRLLTADANDALSSAYGPVTSSDMSFPDDAAKAKYLDEQLNAVYKGLRFILPPARFAEIKQEQIAWLKQRDAAGSDAQKLKLIDARITALQDLLW